MKKLQQILLLIACLLVVAVAAVQRDGKLLGNSVFNKEGHKSSCRYAPYIG